MRQKKAWEFSWTLQPAARTSADVSADTQKPQTDRAVPARRNDGELDLGLPRHQSTPVLAVVSGAPRTPAQQGVTGTSLPPQRNKRRAAHQTKKAWEFSWDAPSSPTSPSKEAVKRQDDVETLPLWTRDTNKAPSALSVPTQQEAPQGRAAPLDAAPAGKSSECTVSTSVAPKNAPHALTPSPRTRVVPVTVRASRGPIGRVAPNSLELRIKDLLGRIVSMEALVEKAARDNQELTKRLSLIESEKGLLDRALFEAKALQEEERRQKEAALRKLASLESKLIESERALLAAGRDSNTELSPEKVFSALGGNSCDQDGAKRTRDRLSSTYITATRRVDGQVVHNTVEVVSAPGGSLGATNGANFRSRRSLSPFRADPEKILMSVEDEVRVRNYEPA